MHSRSKYFFGFLFVCNSSVRIQFTAETDFVKCLADGDTSQIRAYFHSSSFIVTEGQPLPIHLIVENFTGLSDNFSRRGSGYILSQITRLTMRSVKYRPLGVGGSSYVPTPAWLRKKRCVINVQNPPGDERCFLWAVLSALYPADQNADRLSKYLPHQHRVNVDGLQFPLAANKAAKFERQNPTIAVRSGLS